MIKYEIKKIMTNRFFWVMCIIIFVANFFFIYNREYTIVLEKKLDSWEKNQEEYNNVKGKITNETVAYAQNIGDEEFLVYGGSEHYQNIQSAINYKELCVGIVNKANNNMILYSDIGMEDSFRKNEKVVESFEGRQIREYYTYGGVHEYLSYDYSSLFTIVLGLLIMLILFFYDKKCGMDRLVLVSINGGDRVFINKSVVLVIICTILQLLFRIQEFVMYTVLYSFEGVHMPLYSLEEYSHTFVNVSIKEFMLYDIMAKCLGVILYGMTIIIVAKLIKKQGLSLFCFLIIYIITIAHSLSGNVLYSPIQMFDIYALARSEKLIIIGTKCLTHIEFSVGISLVLLLFQVVMVYIVKDK